jgi:hypothetical protein
MHKKGLAILLVLLAAAYSTAPSWVATGVSLNYSVGSDAVTFTVLERSGGDINFQVLTHSTNHKSTAIENESADYGQFWFDTALLANIYTGSTASDFTVTGENQQSFAGKSWDAVTMQATISGATTTKVVDKNTGLLLKQTVDAVGAPAVTLTQYYIPSLAPTPPPTQPPANNPANQTQNQTNQTNGTAQTNQSSAQNQTSTTQPPTPQGNQSNQQTGGNNQSASQQQGSSTTTAKKPLPGCSGAILLTILGFLAISKRNR